MPAPYHPSDPLLPQHDDLGQPPRSLLLQLFAHIAWLLRKIRRVFRHAYRTVRLGCLQAWHTMRLLRLLARLRPRADSLKRFYLIDPSFRGNFGLYDTLARRLRAECAARGWVFIHLTGPFDRWGTDRFSLFAAAALLPTRIPPEHVRSPREWRELRRADSRALRHFSRRLGALLALDRWFLSAGDSYFYFPTGDLLYLYALLDKFRPAPRQHIVSMHFNVPGDQAQPRELRRLVLQSQLLGRRLRQPEAASLPIRLGTDVSALQRLLAPALGASCQFLHFPLLDPNEPDALPLPASLAARPYAWGYFGYASPKHGWPVIDRLLQNAPASASRGFISINPQPGYPEMIEEAKIAAIAAGDSFHFGYWADGEYAAALARCAALLFPYDRPHYMMVSSGKLIDALRHACFPVVPAGTWLAETVQEVDYGLIVQEQDWPGVPRQLATLDLPALWNTRRLRVRDFLQQFTAPSLLASLSAAAR
jgi:hypothetical protein